MYPLIVKTAPMSTEQIKEVLHRRIEQVDESFLRIMYAMAEAYIKEIEDAALEEQIKNIPPPPWAKPMTQEQLEARLAESTAQFERGEYITLEDLEKEMEEW